jgi:hypothetical protein
MNHMTEADLYAYIDGLAPPEIASAIEQSPVLRGRIEYLQQEEATLRHLLLRAPCPDPFELGEYHLGMLSGRPAQRIRQHLAHCLGCQGELAILEKELGVTSRPQMSLSDLARVLIGRLSLPQSSAGQPALATRGTIHNTYQIEVEGWSERPLLALNIEPAPTPQHRRLDGFILGLEDPDQVFLWRSDNEELQTTIDNGYFTFPDLRPDTYTLMFATPTLELHVPGFTLQ